MATRNSWSSYKLQDGLNIWGDPEFKGSPLLAGGFTFGDAVADTLTIKGRMATMTVAGDYVEIPSTYTYGELIELRARVTDWAGIGSQFQALYLRADANIDSTGKTLRAMEIIGANYDNIDVGTLQTFMFNTIGKGNSAITLMRGGEIKCEWAATDVVTDAVGLVIEFMGLSTPTNVVYGLKFEDDSATGAMAAKFYEILMKAGMCVLSGSGAPSMTAPKGSLYLRTDGDGAANRAYINTDAGTTWTAISTAA